MDQTSLSTAGWNLRQSYANLPKEFYSHQKPDPVKDPGMVLLNSPLASTLGLDFDDYEEKVLANLFSGNELPPGSDPISQAYAGHQFGSFTLLGDGRAILLGEQVTPEGNSLDVQLKGAGRSLYSRRGDGRATLASMLREFLVSEAMHGLGIPTTRSLAVVTTGEPVYREQVQAGAVLTRVASSHIRVGTFEYASQYLGKESLKALLDYTIQRHYPEAAQDENPGLAFFHQVLNQQAALVASWMGVGFIHGVMNTDNMSIAGETIDYGPCAFLNTYDPGTVYSSIDVQGRYAFGNQPKIAHWNLSCLASALLPLFHEEKEKAVSIAQDALNAFPFRFKEHYAKAMGRKLGLKERRDGDDSLISDLLQIAEEQRWDYTHTFLFLQGDMPGGKLQGSELPAFQAWYRRWNARVTGDGIPLSEIQRAMQSHNPKIIPRNHLVEATLSQAVQGDIGSLYRFLEVCQNPFETGKYTRLFQEVPDSQWERGYQTFCGT
ncbi:Selenoprotein O and cysteine-like protein [Lunatimonas lonarensis]|uniref:Protein nucleotidyltransferase YdiU n=1 Tax=Lunatimonas lonarensis TaxID=1232681 RepID=R7ZUY3_9BACT|nr:YdiU family protein [Lunatimonas lonarensis]EON77892.1 Selenoprotein O and cysteine-like protein [Lunatimonas lonarensis]